MKKALTFILKVLFFFIIFMIFTTNLKPEKVSETELNSVIDPPFAEYNSQWVDSVFATMTLDQKIGQLFMVAAYPKEGKSWEKDIANLINEYKIGGIIFFQGGPVRLAQMNNYFQSISKIPIMTAIDGEWGLGMRLDSTIDYPHQVMLGAIEDESLIYDMGFEIARQCKRIGINVNFAPVVDIYNNPKNPVISVRSFGENKNNVTRKGFAYMIGMQDNNVLACAKHFPGHGDTDVDSHKDLPVLSHTRERLDSVELFPFKNLIESGIGSIMIAHLYIPAIETTVNTPSSLSKKFITDILINEMKFKGLVFTDALGMEAVTGDNECGEVDLKAFIAGVDILLMSENVPAGFKLIKENIQNGTISEDILNERVKKILRAKQWMGLDNLKPIELEGIYEDLNSPQAELVNRRVVEASLTLVKNADSLVPFLNLEKYKIASVSIGTGDETTFQDYLGLYADIKHFTINKDASATEFTDLLEKLSGFNAVIVGIHKTSLYSTTYFGITSQTISFVTSLSKNTKVVLDIFGNPHSIKRFSDIDDIQSIVMSYEETELSQQLSAQLIFGGISAQGKLPVNVNEKYPIGTGIWDEKVRLKYSIPEELKIDRAKLEKVDSVILGAIEQKAFPGCTVLAAKDGVIFFYKSYGYQTYEKKKLVTNRDIYDLASITKVAATTTALMKLYDDSLFDITKTLGYYLPELEGTDKKNILVRDVLTHQARLKAWIPFYLRTIDNTTGKLDTTWYSDKYSEIFNLQVAENIYIKKEYTDTIYKRIYASTLRSTKKYKYSDMGFYIFYKIIDSLTHENPAKYLEETFYNPLGASTLGYNPIKKFNKDSIMPTEEDKSFRNQLLQGYVHDYGAAIMGGYGGHAGLFSNANDLAKLLQMFIQGGEYAGTRYLNSTTVKLFTSKSKTNVSGNRRALGWDRTAAGGNGPASSLVSELSYGHTGFTGTMVWADPENDLIYIFLSNRIYPDIENNLINDLNVRAKVQSLIYQSLPSESLTN